MGRADKGTTAKKYMPAKASACEVSFFGEQSTCLGCHLKLLLRWRS